MDTVSRSAAEAEFKQVKGAITTGELAGMRDRIAAGNFQGHMYCWDGCGCFWGTLAIVRHPDQKDDAHLGQYALNIKHKLVGPKIASAIEDAVYRVYRGDTPLTSEPLTWLYRLIVAEIERRGQ